jgi:hypothetical protein
MVEHREFADDVKAGIRKWQRLAACLKNKTAGSIALLYGLINKCGDRFDTTNRQMRQRLFQVVENTAGGGADVKDGTSVDHAKNRMKKLHAERISGAFVGVHLLVAVGSFRVVLPLKFSGAVGIRSHAASWGKWYQKAAKARKMVQART